MNSENELVILPEEVTQRLATESFHSDEERSVALGDEDQEEILTWEEKKAYCANFKTVNRLSLAMVFPNPEYLGDDVKSQKTFENINLLAMTPNSKLEFGVTVEETVRVEGSTTKEVRMALKIKAKNAPSWEGYLLRLQVQVSGQCQGPGGTPGGEEDGYETGRV